MMQVAEEKTGVLPKQPSLLRQIVDKADLLSEIEQHQLLLYLQKDELLQRAAQIDKQFEGAFKDLTDEEISEMVSNDRKAHYEQTTGH